MVPSNQHRAFTMYTDASGDFEAFIAPGCRAWAAHQWTAAELVHFTTVKAISMPAMEAAAIYAALVWAIRRRVGDILIRTDSEVSLKAIIKGGSPSTIFNEILRAIIILASSHTHHVMFDYVNTHANPADIPTRLTPLLLQDCWIQVGSNGGPCQPTTHRFRNWARSSRS